MEKNAYLDEVLQQQRQVEQEMHAPPAPPRPAASQAPVPRKRKPAASDHEEEELSLAGVPTRTPDYRITGWWRQSVVVAPNVYVVHTRRGHTEPLHVGLGLSFHFNPYTDAFLTVPATVQTLLINARCISRERQGILVQAYMQWIIDDIRTAYRKLDFSDPSQPTRIVSVQLREQAEAAIKDKVATMPIDAILSDKQPIIEELTHRLRVVAEGNRANDPSSGLGLKIVTVQIKEAVVSSTRLWENLQGPFRAEREKLAKLATLEAQEEVARRERLDRQAREQADFEYRRQQGILKADLDRETYNQQHAEKARRLDVEQQSERQAIAQRAETTQAAREAELRLALQQMELEARRVSAELEATRRQMELEQTRAELERQRAQAAIDIARLQHEAEAARAERDVELLRQRRAVDNDVTDAALKSQLIARLPEVAAALPKPDEVRTVTVGGSPDGPAASLLGLVAGVMGMVERNGKG